MDTLKTLDKTVSFSGFTLVVSEGFKTFEGIIQQIQNLRYDVKMRPH